MELIGWSEQRVIQCSAAGVAPLGRRRSLVIVRINPPATLPNKISYAGEKRHFTRFTQRADQAGGGRESAPNALPWLPKLMQSAKIGVTDFFTEMMNGEKIRISYQGGPGACGEAVAFKLYPNGKAVPFHTVEDVVKAVVSCKAHRAVLPVENSTDGLIHRNYDLLIQYPVNIVGEVAYPDDYNLLVLPGVEKEGIARVISHSGALSQCKDTLTNLGLTGSHVVMASTAGAAKYIAENGLRDAAAIASELYGLKKLEFTQGRVHDYFDNSIRFAILGREPAILCADEKCKTSIVFAEDEKMGVLLYALSVFNDHNIHLSMINQVPGRRRMIRVEDGEDIFSDRFYYADFEASMADVQKALKCLQKRSPFVRVFGIYPKE